MDFDTGHQRKLEKMNIPDDALPEEEEVEGTDEKLLWNVFTQDKIKQDTKDLYQQITGAPDWKES